MIKTYSRIPLKSSAIVGNLWKFLENVRERLSALRKIFGNLRKVVLSKIVKNASISMSNNKKHSTLLLKDMNFMFWWRD